MILKGIKRKVAVGAMAAGLVLGTASMASAEPAPSGGFGSRVSYDCFPASCDDGFYYSSESNPGAAFTDVGNSSTGWGIKWSEGGDSVRVRGILSDRLADGNGATVYFIKYPFGTGSADGVQTKEFRATNGAGTSTNVDYTFTGINWDNAAIQVVVCNGKSSTGDNQRCVGHGPFHSY